VDDLPVSEEAWAGYEHVNVQRALDRWLAGPGREHRVVGLTDYRHRGQFGLGDLLVDSMHAMHGPRPGAVTRVARASGPSGATEECLRAALVLVEEGEDRLVALFRGPDHDMDNNGVRLEVVATDEDAVRRFTASLRDLVVEENVYRGQVVSFGGDLFGERGSLLRFHERPEVTDAELILPSDTFEDIRRQVVGVARNRDRLRSAGQHLKRGLLLYGPPGAGKTHTVRYLMSELADTTIVELTGESLGALREACSIARTLQPAMIVVEDVDLIAEQRDHYSGQTPCCSPCSTRWTGWPRTPTSCSCSPRTAPTCSSRRWRRVRAASTRRCTSASRTRRDAAGCSTSTAAGWTSTPAGSTRSLHAPTA
jgi:hypothetical protein